MIKFIYLSLLTTIILLLFACQPNDDENQISVMVPFGSTQLAQLYLEADPFYDVDVVSGPDLLISAFSAQTHDVIIAPMNLGAKLYHNHTAYQCLAVIVWGNFYIVSHKEVFHNVEDLDGKTITMFGQNQTADIILSFIIEAYDIEITRVYVDSLMTAQAMLISDQADIILTAEPSLSVLSQSLDLISTLDLQEVYQDITQTSSYPQAGVFVHKRLSPALIETLSIDLKASIDGVNQDPESAALLAIQLGIDLEVNILVQAIYNSHLNYVSAQLAKDAIEDFFDIILSINPNLIGQMKPHESFYMTP